jgi:hypothetical protein
VDIIDDLDKRTGRLGYDTIVPLCTKKHVPTNICCYFIVTATPIVVLWGYLFSRPTAGLSKSLVVRKILRREAHEQLHATRPSSSRTARCSNSNMYRSSALGISFPNLQSIIHISFRISHVLHCTPVFLRTVAASTHPTCITPLKLAADRNKRKIWRLV